MSARWKKAGIASVGCLVLLLLAAYVAMVRSRTPSAVYKAQLLAAGEKLKIAELLPPRVPSESNSAPIFRQVMPGINSLGLFDSNLPPLMRMVTPGKAMVGWQQSDVHQEDSRGTPITNTWDDVEFNLSQFEPVLARLHEMATFPRLDFDFDYNNGFNLRLSHLSALKRAHQLLGAATILDLHNGDTESAATNIDSMLALVNATADERLIISQVIRAVAAQIAATATWELLQATNLNDSALARLQRNWSALEFIRPMENGMLMERAMIVHDLERLRATNNPAGALIWRGSSASPPLSGNFVDDLAELWGGARRKTAMALWQASWSYADERRFLEAFQIRIQTLRRVEADGFFKDALAEQKKQLKSWSTNSHDRFDWLWDKLDADNMRHSFSQIAETSESFAQRTFRIEAARNIVATAIALKRFELRYHHIPRALAELTPEFLLNIPNDPVDGQPLRYRLKEDGTFLLYSIGEDGVDDKGDLLLNTKVSPPFYWLSGRDWVWPQPATEQEIEDYGSKGFNQ